MKQLKKDKSNPRGAEFRDRVYLVIKKLEALGLAKNIKKEVILFDRDNNPRKIDISFIMCEFTAEYLISIECKSRDRNISLNDIDQIKVYKNELPGRNIFWMVSDADASESVLKSLANNCIPYYTIEDFEFTVSSICNQHKKCNFKRLEGDNIKFSTMNVTQNTNLRSDSQKSNNMMVKNPSNSLFSINQSKNISFSFYREQYKKAS